jgi:hypothetical protein
VKFYYIYKSLEHPGINGYKRPLTLTERLLHVKEAKQRIGSEFIWLCDNMQNEFHHALGKNPNSEFIVGPDGKFVVQREWSNPDQLRDDLMRLVGAVENPTAASDIDVRFTPPAGAATSGERPGGDTPGGHKPPW